ncbi:MAG: hypothetical protein AAGC68_12690, partial [Verrucomicrobiota bacterium]
SLFFVLFTLAVHGESEPGDNAYTGADSLTAGGLPGGGEISLGDEDWIIVSKNSCHDITVRVANLGGLTDILKVELFTRTASGAPTTNAVAETFVIGGNSGTLRYSLRGVTGVFARVTPVDVTGTIQYIVSTTSTDVNIAIRAEIDRNEKRLKKLQKRLKNTDKSKMKKIKRLKKRIKIQREKIAGLRATLCTG